MLPRIEGFPLSKYVVNARCGRDSLIDDLLQSLGGTLATKNGAIANVVSSLSRELLFVERQDVAADLDQSIATILHELAHLTYPT